MGSSPPPNSAPGPTRRPARKRESPGEEMTKDAPLLELEGVSKRFGPVQALDQVDFAAHPGDDVALGCDNGAGKSTLVKTIAGIHTADAGTIRFDGREVTIARPH